MPIISITSKEKELLEDILQVEYERLIFVIENTNNTGENRREKAKAKKKAVAYLFKRLKEM